MSEVRTLRIPEELWAWLQADADRYGRTVAQSVRFYLTNIMQAQNTATISTGFVDVDLSEYGKEVAP